MLSQVVLDKTYTIGSVLQTEDLSNIAIQLSGTVSLSTDLSYWQKNSIQLTYQDAYTAWAIGGSNIHVSFPLSGTAIIPDVLSRYTAAALTMEEVTVRNSLCLMAITSVC